MAQPTTTLPAHALCGDELAALWANDREAAISHLRRLTPNQLAAQALQHSQWLSEAHGQQVDPIDVLERYQRALSDRPVLRLVQNEEDTMTEPTNPTRTVCGVPIAFIEAEAQRRAEHLTAHLNHADRDEAAHARRRINALNKAVKHALEGVTVHLSMGDYLVSSGTRAGVIHRVSQRYGCSCEAAAKDQPCWHAELADILAAGQDIPLEAA